MKNVFIWLKQFFDEHSGGKELNISAFQKVSPQTKGFFFKIMEMLNFHICIVYRQYHQKLEGFRS